MRGAPGPVFHIAAGRGGQSARGSATARADAPGEPRSWSRDPCDTPT
jgi:hypothetical protein